MTKVKICGIRRPEDITYVNVAKPEYIGFVFAPSRRQVSKEQAKHLKQLLKPSIQAVGVFVNASLSDMIAIAHEGIIDIIQLHGQEDNQIIQQIKSAIDVSVIQAFCVRTPEDLLRAKESEADYLLLDYKQAGSGQTFDWNLLEQAEDLGRPFFLAGGISAENVQEAIERFHPYAVDASSSVEENGDKKQDKIEEIIRRIRNV